MNPSTLEIRRHIYNVREHFIVLDSDLAQFYETETRTINQAVQRNRRRFPSDFRFKLTPDEHKKLRSLPSFVSKHGGSRHVPFVYTEHGVGMLASVLKSSRAIEINIVLMRSFAEARQKGAITLDNERLSNIESQIGEIRQLLITKIAAPLPQIEDTSSRIPEASHPLKNLYLDAESNSKVGQIHQSVASYFGLKVSELKATSRSRTIVLPRQIAIYLVRTHTGISFHEIGRTLSLRNHTTCLHAFNKISTSTKKTGAIQEAVFTIQKTLASGPK